MFSIFKNKTKNNRFSTNNLPESNDTNNPETEQGAATETEGGESKKLVCQGAICACNQTQVPSQAVLKVKTQSKFYINDSGGSQKLIATDKDITNPFEAPFPVTCKMQPIPNIVPTFKPCAPNIIQWKDVYDNVELANGGKILLENSTAICMPIGGVGAGEIQIKKHGQDPAQVSAQQIENENAAAIAILNPTVLEDQIVILAGGVTDDDEVDQKGSSVKQITTVSGKKVFVNESTIAFKVKRWSSRNPTKKDKVNWVVYNDQHVQIQEHIDIGETFNLQVFKNGKYIVEAYGSSKGGRFAAEFRITVKESELNSITKNVGSRIRVGESATFTLKPDVGTFEDVTRGVKWEVLKGRTIVENIITGKSYNETAIFTEAGKYTIRATYKGKTKVINKFSVGKNYITSINASKTTIKLEGDSAKFEIPKSSFIIQPPTPEELAYPTWVVYDSNFNKIESYSARGLQFTFDKPPKTGIYYIEAYMNSSEMLRKQGKASTIKKIEVVQPTVIEAQWRYKDGKRKARTGYKNEISYIYAKLKSFHNATATIEVYNAAKQKIAEIKDCKANNRGVIIQEFKMQDAFKTNITDKNNSLFFKIIGKNEKIKSENTTLYPKAGGLKIITKELIQDAYFTKNGKRLRATPVEYGVTVQGVVETQNMVGETLEVDVYRTQKILYIDSLKGDPMVFTKDLKVDNEGRIIFDFTVEKKWWRENDYLGRNFYIGIEKADWAVFRKEQIFKGSIQAYKKGDQVAEGVTPITVEKANYKKKKEKKGRCENCNKDITLEEIKAICTIKDDAMITAALPYLNEYRKKIGLDTCTRKAHFLAQLGVESNFETLQENFNWSADRLLRTFTSYFKQFSTQQDKEAEAKRLGRKEGQTKLTQAEQETLANAIYGSTHPIGKEAKHKEGDGWRYSGKGFKQITWKTNYKAIQKRYNKCIKNEDEPDVLWLGGENPYKLKNNAKDAMVSALAYWDLKYINARADIGDSYEAVTAVSKAINASDDSLPKRYELFQKAIQSLNAKECIDYKRREDEVGTVVIIEGKAHDTHDYKNSRGKVALKNVIRYKTRVYRSMTLEKFKKLRDEDKLPIPDYVTYLSRDAHGDKIKYGIHSAQRYGTNNECPPGEYYLIPKISKKQEHTMYFSDDNKQPIIKRPNYKREGIAIHNWSPTGSIGCLTTVEPGQTTKKNSLGFLEQELGGNLADLKIENRDVRVILEERIVKEEPWVGSVAGSPTKWTGVLEDETK